MPSPPIQSSFLVPYRWAKRPKYGSEITLAVTAAAVRMAKLLYERCSFLSM